jgi:diaminopimelate epimerase
VSLSFDKYEGLGNDFIVVEQEGAVSLGPVDALGLCDRHFGVGADGVLLVTPAASPSARARMLVLNADGSRPEMCGNGLRCVALHLARRDGAVGVSYEIETDAGPLSCEVERDGDSGQVTVGMGRGRPEPELSVEVEGRVLVLARVSMGNPHAITFDEPLDAARADQLGPAVSAAVPGGTNLELARQRGSAELDLLVWERGVGRTLACGTGACATAVAAARAGLVRFGEPIRVNLPGGALEIVVEEGTLEVRMRGPARRVFSGSTVA